MPKSSAPSTSAKKKPAATAETMAAKQKEIAVSEFFAKNRHLLGFDNPRKALLTTIKEAVDNSLDACEEAGILPDIHVTIEALNGGTKRAKKPKDAETPVSDSDSGVEEVPSLTNATKFKVTVRDNGPGIVKAQIPNVFGRLLYGSKFHRLRMSRGQQGIGISAAGMYGLLTTGQPVQIISKTGPRAKCHRFELAIDTLKNRPEITVDDVLDEWTDRDGDKIRQGTEVAITLEGKFQRGRASVDEYLEQTAIANPHARIVYTAPDLEHRVFPREVDDVPETPDEIKPHPYGVELGVLMRMLKETKHSKLGEFLQQSFSRVSPKVAKEITDIAGKAKVGTITLQSYCSSLNHGQIEAIHNAISETKIQNPPTDCLVPIGPQQILKGLLKEIKAEFYTAETRDPQVYRGNPFQIEVGLAFGGDIPAGDGSKVIRFANRVPLLYQPAACSITKAVVQTNWRNYGMSQPRSSLPDAPLVVFIHMASVWVPFTSESKEAIADYDEIRKEITLAIKECGRKLNTYIRRKQRVAREGQRRDVFAKYIGEVVAACGRMTELDPEKLFEDLKNVARSRTETADRQLDDEGNFIKPAKKAGKLDGDANVVVIERDDDEDEDADASAAEGESPAITTDQPEHAAA
ncbi:MAG: DNA topoisomerase VI subunit B [Planctomycetota bacterium]